MIINGNILDIYKNIGFFDLSEKIDILSKEDRYLLLLIILQNDRMNWGSDILISNLFIMENEIKQLKNLESYRSDDFLSKLSENSGYEFISIENFRDLNGNKIPDPPYSIDDIRKLKLNKVFI